MRIVIKAAVCAAMLWWCFDAPAAFAGQLDDGLAAEERGHYATALRYLRPLAEQGNAEAQYKLGDMYHDGRGWPRDDIQAVSWYRKAAEQGYVDAQISLGFMYRFGLGVTRDDAQAMNWYRKAAEQGDTSAQESLEKLLAKQQEAATESAANKNRQVAERRAAATQKETDARKDAARKDAAQKQANDKAEMAAQIDAAVRKQVAAALNAAAENKEAAARKQTATEAAPAADAVAAGLLAPGGMFGEYYALVIGNSQYRHLPKLPSARKDAEQVSKVLRERYGFKVTTLLDASRADILDTLEKLRESLTDEQNLLIYYAGHGDIDKVNQRGNWLPVDARRDSTTNWIKNIDVSDILNRMTARQIMLVVDSCYSGTLTRNTGPRLAGGMSDAARAKWLQTMAPKYARVALSSGGIAPVLDGGGGEHSVFARAFLDALEANSGILEGARLSQMVSEAVVASPATAENKQLPQYGQIGNTGHEGGDFFLFPEGAP